MQKLRGTISWEITLLTEKNCANVSQQQKQLSSLPSHNTEKLRGEALSQRDTWTLPPWPLVRVASALSALCLQHPAHWAWGPLANAHTKDFTPGNFRHGLNTRISVSLFSYLQEWAVKPGIVPRPHSPARFSSLCWNNCTCVICFGSRRTTKGCYSGGPDLVTWALQKRKAFPQLITEDAARDAKHKKGSVPQSWLAEGGATHQGRQAASRR